MNDRAGKGLGLDAPGASDAPGSSSFVSIASSATAVRAEVRRPWHARLADAVPTYLPLLVMLLLALGSWWLVKNTPLFDHGRAPVAPAHVPDYTMTTFMVQRFAREGALRVQIEGDVLRHYPDTDTIEVDNPRVRAIGAKGDITRATAKRALSNADGSEIQFFDDAHVVREATADAAEIDFRGEFLHAFTRTERVRSHLPVVITQGGTQIRSASLDYDNLARHADFGGPNHATFPAQGRGVAK